jgi:DNA polymerase-3 subunit delta
MFDNQKQGWVTAYVRRHGGQIDQDAADLLLELVPNNTLEMGHELDRLMAFVGRHITADDVDRYIYHGREESVFTLFDAVVEEDLDRSLEIASKILASTDSVQIIAGLTWQFDRLARFHMLRRHGVPDKQCFDASNLNIRSKRTQKLYFVGIKRYNGTAVLRILRTLNDFDGLARSLPTALHDGLVVQGLYSIIKTHGRWTPGTVVDTA